MHLLTVYSHPLRHSYPGAVMDAFHQPILDAGHTVDILDLHRENFDPRFTKEDHACFWGEELPVDIPPMHSRVENADQLAFVFPVYWWSMPALMKGWIDRVFTGGWAYQYGDGVEDRGKAALMGRLTNLPTVLIGVGGSKKSTYDKYEYANAMRTQLDLGIFAYCGITDVESHLIYDVEGDHNTPNRERGLELAEQISQSFISPSRQPLNAKDAFLRARSV
ncbi:NAD(P)H-dependent oxidoreductase [Reinekea blandensis]|uniref:NAD(P)H dehydrogenase n=1 Tax=Reinekea blandensis MED297 TaxID=314283 RepID=A4BBU7_9GAMM|nr:NAD(P)H-dependent oxidoreductase [Reinekea blandensis]EAR10432.1 NAD(P)H dehydrogenase [Reinekea sp. MED297] [Reinekea blandensis MED297]